jgi:hypothetical protein
MSSLLRTCTCVAAGLAFGIVTCAAAEAAPASGNLTYKGRSVAIKHAWLVTGPSDMEPGKTVRRLVLSTSDIGAKLEACRTFSCTDGEVMEGATVDFTGGPRLSYWTAMDGQKVQYSGTARPESFSPRTDEGARLAGHLAIDDTSAGGAKLDADFDVSAMKEFKVAR